MANAQIYIPWIYRQFYIISTIFDGDYKNTYISFHFIRDAGVKVTPSWSLEETKEGLNG